MAVKGGRCPGCGGPGDSGEMLFKLGFVARAELDAARAISDDPVQWLYDRGTISGKAYYTLQARRSGMVFADLDQRTIETFPLPMDAARSLGALPIKQDGETLWVAFRDPRDPKAVRTVEKMTGFCIVPVVAVPEQIDAMIERLIAQPHLQRPLSQDPGEMLVRKQYITEDQLAEARTAGDDPIRWLLERKTIGEHEFAMARAWEHRMAYIGGYDGSLRNACPDRIPQELARKLGILPLALSEGAVRVAISEPRDWESIHRAREALGLRVEPVAVMRARDIAAALASEA